MACVSVCGVLATFASFEMVDKVNENLPEVEKFGHLAWSLSKRSRLYRTYRKFYPNGRLILRVRILSGLMFASLLVAAWTIGFFVVG